MLDGNHRARKFFESFDWWRHTPKPDVIGAGSAKAYCLADGDDGYALWLPEGGRVFLQIRGSFRAVWFDPRTDAGFGKWFIIRANADPVPVSAPDAGTAGPETRSDWALYIEPIERGVYDWYPSQSSA